MERIADTYIEKFIKFLKTDNIGGCKAAEALETMTTANLKHHFERWTKAGEPETGIDGEEE